MTDQNTSRKVIPANYSEQDTRMAKWIFFGFMLLGFTLLALMALPQFLQAGK